MSTAGTRKSTIVLCTVFLFLRYRWCPMMVYSCCSTPRNDLLTLNFHQAQHRSLYMWYVNVSVHPPISLILFVITLWYYICDNWYIDIHTYIHTYLPTYLPTYLQTDRQTDRQTDMHTYTHTHIHTYTHTHTCIHTHIHIYIHIHTHTYIDADILT